MMLNIKNEYNKINKVLLGPNLYQEENDELVSIFNKYNIEILYTNKINNCFLQMFVRDPFIVIDDKILISNMKEKIRKDEINSINEILKDIEEEKIIKVPDNIYIEGGDIIIHNGYIFVGQNGNRTSKETINYLKEIFSNYKIIPLNMINPNANNNWIHLDCLFNPISNDTALIYKKGFNKESLDIINNIFNNLIEINYKEQNELAINIFSIGNKTLIMQKRHTRLLTELKKNGFNIELLDKYDTIEELGYVRCLTCPLDRD